MKLSVSWKPSSVGRDGVAAVSSMDWRSGGSASRPSTRCAVPGHGQGRLGRPPSSLGRRTVQPFEASASPWVHASRGRSRRPSPGDALPGARGRERRSAPSIAGTRPALYAFLLRVCRGRASDAEESLQECWMRAVESLREFRWESTFAVVARDRRETARASGGAARRSRATGTRQRTPAAEREDVIDTVDLERAIEELPDGFSRRSCPPRRRGAHARGDRPDARHRGGDVEEPALESARRGARAARESEHRTTEGEPR
jgi:hypothetical protein